MIADYHRPNTLDEALSLLARPSPLTLPLAGGTWLNQPSHGFSDQSYDVVDLQDLVKQPELGLGQVQLAGNVIEIGAGVTLQRLADESVFPQAVQTTLNRILLTETTFNLQQVATLAGTIVSSTARSGLTAALLAMDAALEIASLKDGLSVESLGDFLVLRPVNRPGRLILKIKLQVNLALAYTAVSRTPMDFPLVSAAVASWPSGRTRLVLGGYGKAPLLVFDGPSAEGAGYAAQEAFRDAGDEWASASYRCAVAETLVSRGLSSLQEVLND